MEALMAVLGVALVTMVVVVIVGFGVWRQRTRRPRTGPAQRDVRAAADGRRARSREPPGALERRPRRFEPAPLGAALRDAYLSEWETIQSRFIDDPQRAVDDAERLATALMRARGYPMSEFEERAEEIAAVQPEVVGHYRVAARIAASNARGEAGTEELRQAMRHLRALFGELLRVRPSDHVRPWGAP